MSKPTLIAIADGTAILAESLAAVLSRSGDHKVVFTASSGNALIEALQDAEHLPEILIMDTALSLNELNVVEHLQRFYPAVRLLFHYEAIESTQLFWLMRMGGRAFLPKSGSIRHMLKALGEIVAKGYHFSGEFTASVLRTVAAIQARAYPSFSANEYRVMPYFALGWSCAQVSITTHISERMLRKEKEKIFHKIPVHNSSELLRFCIAHGIMALHDIYEYEPPRL